MAKVGVAVIGIGGWGKNHVRVYRELKDLCTLKAVCDQSEQRTRHYGSIFKVDFYTDLDDLLKRDDIDALSICLPPHLHPKATIEALKAEKHVFIEKPMALNLQDALQIHQAVKQSEMKLMVGFIERFNSGVSKIKSLLENGELGFTSHICASRISSKPDRQWRIDIIHDLAIHDIDLIRYLSGENPSHVFAKTRGKKNGEDKEECIEIFLSLPSGRSSHIIAEWIPQSSSTQKIRQLQITGSRGTAILSLIPQLVWKIDAVDILSPFINEEGKPNYSKTPEEATLIKPLNWLEPLKYELKSFLESLIHNKAPPVTSEDGVRALEIAKAAKLSVKFESPKKIHYINLA